MPIIVIAQHDRGDEVSERQTPTGEDQPQEIAKKTEWASA
jgi:hypothetical protein